MFDENGSMVVYSPYLVQRLQHQGEDLYAWVKWSIVREWIARTCPEGGLVLELGSGSGSGRHWLSGVNYIGVDREAALRPDLVHDVRDIEGIARRLPGAPRAVLILDVLEHFEGKLADIHRVLSGVARSFIPGTRILISVPQWYRLDTLGLSRLHYPEHKVRLRHHEWARVIDSYVSIDDTQPLGVLSVIPYLIMLWPWYYENGRSGRLFHWIRDRLMPRLPFLRPLDCALSRFIGSLPGGTCFGNSLLFVCRVR